MKKLGFSLMEMMIVLLIVSVVLACSAPMVNQKLSKTEAGSPWVFTNAAGSSAYNMRGSNNITSLIGTTILPANVPAIAGARQYIQAENTPQIALGGAGNTRMGLTVKNNSIFLTDSDVREVNNSPNSILIGTGTASTAGADSAVAIGRDAIANRNSAIAIGNNSDATSLQAIAIGVNAQATTDYAIAIGEGAEANAEKSIAIGDGASVNASHTISSGRTGATTTVNNTNSIAIGAGVVVNEANTIVLGTDAMTVRIPGNLVIGNDDMTFTHDGNAIIRSGGLSVFDDIITHGGYARMAGRTYTEFSDGCNGTWSGRSSGRTGSSSSRTSSSDRRLKDVGEAFTAGLEQIKKLELFNYTFKKDKSKTPQVGVMAQDLQKIFPNAVREGEDGFLRIRWDEMFYATINAIKDLDKKIEALTVNQKQVDELTKKLEKLEKENKELVKQNKDFEKRFEKLEKQIKELK